jgi:cell division protein FtsA
MFTQQPSYITALDIGTSKITAITSLVTETGPLKKTQIIGLCSQQTSGIKKGFIINPQQCIAQIKELMGELKKQTHIPQHCVIAGMSASDSDLFTSKATVAIPSGIVTQKELNQVLRVASHCTILDPKSQAIHALPLEFAIDGHPGIQTPLNHAGTTLQVTTQIIATSSAATQTLHLICKQAGVKLRQIIFEPWATSFAVLRPHERDLGVGLLEIGAGNTNLAIWQSGLLVCMKTLPLGGQDITRKLAQTLSVSIEVAERIKLELQTRPPTDKAGQFHLETRTIAFESVKKIVDDATIQLLESARAQLEEVFHLNDLFSGVVLTGGATLLEGIQQLAQKVFKIDPERIRTGDFLGVLADDPAIFSLLQNPQNATCIGLIKYAQDHCPNAHFRDSFAHTGLQYLETVPGRLKEWTRDLITQEGKKNHV